MTLDNAINAITRLRVKDEESGCQTPIVVNVAAKETGLNVALCLGDPDCLSDFNADTVYPIDGLGLDHFVDRDFVPRKHIATYPERKQRKQCVSRGPDDKISYQRNVARRRRGGRQAGSGLDVVTDNREDNLRTLR